MARWGEFVSFAPQCPIRFVDRFNQSSEAWSLIDWPSAAEAVAKEPKFVLCHKRDGHDPLPSQDNSPKMLRAETNRLRSGSYCFGCDGGARVCNGWKPAIAQSDVRAARLHLELVRGWRVGSESNAIRPVINRDELVRFDNRSDLCELIFPRLLEEERNGVPLGTSSLRVAPATARRSPRPDHP